MINCKARREGDQVSCGRCGLAWDVNDDDPPECLSNEEVARKRAEQARDVAKQKLKGVLK